MKKTNQIPLEFPSEMPPEVRELVSQQLRDWENDREIQAAIEAAAKFDESEVDKLNAAAEQIAKKLGIAEHLAELTEVLNARAGRVDALLFEHRDITNKASEGDS